MKRILVGLGFSLLLLALGCGGKEAQAPAGQGRAANAATPQAPDVRALYPEPPAGLVGQIVYVPIYSSIFYFDSQQTRELSAMLSIHNIDLEKRIELTRVDYYNTKGQLVRTYLEQPVGLNPLETTSFVVAEQDRTGGTGANFIVAWQAPGEISPPLVEAVMTGSSSAGMVSLTSSGKVTRSFGLGRTHLE
ncbi:MAG: DUF3124 domain-containing protein [Candidatus Latescibacteria bacterium]|nr:DUF3124 domain-containing protein [Candidatus Latescibacterota bacterium]